MNQNSQIGTVKLNTKNINNKEMILKETHSSNPSQNQITTKMKLSNDTNNNNTNTNNINVSASKRYLRLT